MRARLFRFALPLALVLPVAAGAQRTAAARLRLETHVGVALPRGEMTGALGRGVGLAVSTGHPLRRGIEWRTELGATLHGRRMASGARNVVVDFDASPFIGPGWPVDRRAQSYALRTGPRLQATRHGVRAFVEAGLAVAYHRVQQEFPGGTAVLMEDLNFDEPAEAEYGTRADGTAALGLDAGVGLCARLGRSPFVLSSGVRLVDGGTARMRSLATASPSPLSALSVGVWMPEDVRMRWVSATVGLTYARR